MSVNVIFEGGCSVGFPGRFLGNDQISSERGVEKALIIGVMYHPATAIN